MRIFPTPRYRNAPELLDAVKGVSERDLQTTLRDIRRANIFGLGTWVIKHHLADLLRDVPPGAPISVLDLATGSGDIPEELCRWGRREGHNLSFVLSDVSEEILNVARQRIERAGFGDKAQFVVCDATRPPFPERSFDVVTCSLALHHLDLKQARVALNQMSRLARRCFIVNDIYRSRGAWYMAWMLTRLTTTSRLTRNDGPTSVLRAYTPAELRRMSAEADANVSLYTYPFWRMALVGRVER